MLILLQLPPLPLFRHLQRNQHDLKHLQQKEWYAIIAIVAEISLITTFVVVESSNCHEDAWRDY